MSEEIPPLPKDIYLMIIKYSNPLPIFRMDILCTCKLFLELCLTYLWQPWKHQSSRKTRIYMDDRRSLCYDGPVTGLLWAISEGYVDYFRKWNAVAASVGKPFDLSYSNWYPFHKAFENGHYEMIKYMLYGHPDDPHFTPVHPSVCLNTALSIACFNHRIDIIKLLLEDKRILLSSEYLHNPKYPDEFTEPLIDAIESCDIETVKLIMAEKRLEMPRLEKILEIDKIVTPEMFKFLWNNEMNNENIGKIIGNKILNKIMTCYSDEPMFNNTEIANLIISSPKFNLTFDEGQMYIEMAYKKNRPKILKLFLRHPVMKDYDYEKYREEEMKKPVVKKKGLGAFFESMNDDGR